MNTLGFLKVPKFYTCIFPSRSGNAGQNTNPDVPSNPPPPDNEDRAQPPKPSLIESTSEPNQEFYALLSMFCYIVGSVAVLSMAIISIWITGFVYARRFTIYFYNTKRNTQIIFLVAGGVFFLWILVHTLLLSPSPKCALNNQRIIAKPNGTITNQPKEVKKEAAKKVQTPKQNQTKPAQVTVKPKAVATAPIKVSNKSVCTSPPVKSQQPVQKEKKKVEVKDDKPNCMLRWLCPLFHTHSPTGMKSVGTQIEKKKQCTKAVMATGTPPKQNTKVCGAKEPAKAPMPCSGKQQPTKKQVEVKSKPKASGACAGSCRACGGESSSSESISQLKSNLKTIQQQPNKVSPQQAKQMKSIEADVNNIQKQPEHEPKRICNVLATQHDPRKQCLNQIQISVEEGRQIYNRHRWYVTFLEMKQPPTILVYLRDYIMKYMES